MLFFRVHGWIPVRYKRSLLSGASSFFFFFCPARADSIALTINSTLHLPFAFRPRVVPLFAGAMTSLPSSLHGGTLQGDEAEYMDNRIPNVPQVFGNSRKIPTQITSIAHYVRKSGGKPRMLLLPLGELSLYKAFFSDRVYEVSGGGDGVRLSRYSGATSRDSV